MFEINVGEKKPQKVHERNRNEREEVTNSNKRESTCNNANERGCTAPVSSFVSTIFKEWGGETDCSFDTLHAREATTHSKN